MTTKTRFATKSLACLLAVAAVLPAALASVASAASLQAVTVRFDRMALNTPTTGTVCAKPATALTEATVKVTFPTGYTLGAAGTFLVNNSSTNAGWPAGATGWLGIATASNVTGQVVTFASTDLVVGTLYCFNWTSTTAVQTKSSATQNNTGLVETYTVAPALIDSTPYSTSTIANDQILVTASVPQAFTFTLSGNSDALGPLASASIGTGATPRTVQIDTNAAAGWTVWASDLNVGLKSASAGNYVIPSRTPGTNSTLVAGAIGYNTGVTSANGGGLGTITVDAAFVGGASGKGGGLNTSPAIIATSNGSATAHVLTLTNNATIAGSTPAATDYTDTITVVGAATF